MVVKQGQNKIYEGYQKMQMTVGIADTSAKEREGRRGEEAQENLGSMV